MITNAWAVLIALVAAAVSTGTVLWLYARPLRRLSADAHWSDAAMHFWHLRIARMLSTIWIVMAALASSYDELAKGGDHWLIVLIAGAALAGCVIGSRTVVRGLPVPEIVRRNNLRFMLTHLLLFPGTPCLFILMALTFRHGLSTQSFAIAGVILILNIALMMGGSVAILRMTGLLKPVDETLRESVSEQAAEQGVPLRHIMKMDLPMANAFAFPWTKDLGFTSATFTTLDHDELKSVISHELGHLRESLPTRWSRLIGLLSFFTIGLFPAACLAGQPLVALGLFAGHIGISRLAAWIHKRLEISADRHARDTESEDGVYARALEKIHKANLILAVLHSRSSYPSLYDRMIHAGVNPDFPRPSPPGRVLPFLCGVFATGLFSFCREFLAALGS